jgi:hypothetical protein
MVNGLELFRDAFAGFKDCYTLIGGAACDLWMGEQGLEFRATRDLDIVLAFDGQRPDFVAHLWAFVKAGGYAGYQAGETPSNFYRFQKPSATGYPYTLEICAKRPLDTPPDLNVMRIPAGEDVSSLSAILLDSEYYELVRRNAVTLQGVPAVTGACLMPLKAKACLNLSERKAAGAHVDQKDIDKHRNDVFRLLLAVSPADRIELAATIREDMGRFIERLTSDSPVWNNIRDSLKSNGLTLLPPSEMIRAFREFHGLPLF